MNRSLNMKRVVLWIEEKILQLPGRIPPPPVPHTHTELWIATGLLHGAHCLLHLPLIPPYSWRFVSEFTQRRTSCLPVRGATSVHGCVRRAECKLQRIVLSSMKPASNLEALRWQGASQNVKPSCSFCQRPQCVEVDVWATAGLDTISRYTGEREREGESSMGNVKGSGWLNSLV